MRAPLELPHALAAGYTIDELALLVVRDLRPDAAIERTRQRFEEMAAPLRERHVSVLKPTNQAALLAEHVFLEHQFRANETDYYDPRNSDLTEVVDRKLGIPLTLAIVMIAVGRRSGLNVRGVGFPGHFLVRVGASEEGVLVDPFADGRALDLPGLSQLAKRHLGGPGRLLPEHVAVVDERSMLVRLLLNLKLAHERQKSHAAAMVACDRLVDLTQTVEFRRDRGLHALALGADLAAIADLEAYLAETPSPPDEGEIRGAIQRARRGAFASRLS